ncbi:MAG: DeoR/GlpR family DNA-binding transcription regulator [Lachnospiraceae bacterium]|nr:DeoR/GlpR family DNA-binding transcription regulator [Lachnospiraceae bacterium]
MKYNKRRTKILELLDINGKMSYTQLAESLDVSQATIRRDLVFLEKENAVERYWGGAQRNHHAPVRTRSIMDGVITENLRIIGEIAGGLVQDQEMIFIGSGLTTLTMIDYIQTTKLTVVTNGIPQLESLKQKGINALLLCGFLKEYSRAVVGRQTLDMLREFRFDKAFLGVNGLDEGYGLLSADEYEHDIKKIAIRNSKQSYILAGERKFNRTAMYTIPASATKRAILITNKPMSEDRTWKTASRGYTTRIG